MRWFFVFTMMENYRHGNLKATPSPHRFQLQRILDGGPATFAVAALSSINGYRYAGPIFNIGRSCVETRHELKSGASEQNGARPIFPDENALITVITRPALDDDEDLEKKIIPRTGWEVETKIHEFLRARVFKYLSRRKLEFRAEVIQKFPATLKNRASVEFYRHGNANIKSAQGPCQADAVPPRKGATAGVLVYTPHIEPWLDGGIGPGLCALIGIGGLESLIFLSLLDSRLRSTLQEVVTGDRMRLIYTEFAIPSISCEGCEDNPPSTLRFAAEVDFDVIADVVLD
jgi:hypothetical protein